jgi:hypothetical protein
LEPPAVVGETAGSAQQEQEAPSEPSATGH